MTRLDIISDPICPWCAIGKANLDGALRQRPGHGLDIFWHPFQLNPDMPPEGMDRAEYLALKFGGKEGAVRVYSQIETAAQDAGLTFNFAAITRTPNTLNAHRLIYWAGQEDRQETVTTALFEAYFSHGRDISNLDVLTSIAKDAGMDAPAVARLLASDAMVGEIQALDRDFRARGVGGVPCFIADNHYVVQGAQPSSLWLRVIDEIGHAPQALAT